MPRTLTGIPRNPCRQRVWTDDLVAQELTVRCDRRSLAWYTVWRVRLRIALLVLPIIHDPLWALMYLSVFGAGTIAGMMLITTAIAVPFSCSARFEFLHRHLGAAAGVVSFSFGLFLVYQIGFVDGLLR